jgi:RimJ/RimL family protein N-acetyltransferase
MTAVEGPEVWAEHIADYARNESTAISIAEYIGQLIGMAGIGRGHWPKTRHSSVLWGVYVNPDWRGWHIAEAIIDECITWGCEHGVVVVKLGVITSNTSAIRCYTRSGFKVYDTDLKSNYYDGVYYDELLMVREI